MRERFTEFLELFDVIPIRFTAVDLLGYIVPEIFCVFVNRDIDLETLYRVLVHEFIHWECPYLYDKEVEKFEDDVLPKVRDLLEREVGEPEWIKKPSEKS